MAILTHDQIVSIAESVGFSPSGAGTIAAIALAESSGNTQAIGGPNTNGTYDYGLVQINGVHIASGAISQAQALSPVSALAYALKLSNGGTNFTPWATYTSGAYQKYLSGGSTSATVAPASSTSSTSGLAGIGSYLSSTGHTLLLFTIAITVLIVGLYFLAK